jgi:hypothetical protein
MNLEVKGCGCRFRVEKCEHLCYEHMTEFILELYNRVESVQENNKDNRFYDQGKRMQGKSM